MVQFINDFNYNLKFDNDSINSDFGENSASNFFNAIVTCNELTNERYESFLRALNMYYTSFSNTDIEEDKILILIKLNIIRMSDSVLMCFLQVLFAESCKLKMQNVALCIFHSFAVPDFR